MRFLIVFFIAFIVLIGYLAQLNSGKVVFFVTRDTSFEMTVTALILFSSAVGALLVIVSAGVRETKNLFLSWKYARVQKKEAQVESYYTEAVNSFLAKRFRDATLLFQKALALNPNHVSALLRLGKIYRIEKNFNEAIRLHRKARSLDEQNIEALFALSRDLEEAQRFEEAIQHLKEILRVDETHLTALIRLRDLYIRLTQWEEAHPIQERIMKLPLSQEALRAELVIFLGTKYELGRNFLQRNQPEIARRYFKGGIKLDKSFLPAYIGLAEIHIKEGRMESAGALLEKGYEITRHLILLHRLEDLYLEMGEPERILQIYRNALDKDRHNTVLKFYLGKLYYRLEMIDDAFEALAEIDTHVEYFPDLHKILGNLYLRRGEPILAVEALKKSIKLKKRVVVPYYCANCDYHTIEWSGRCGRCGLWNSYQANPIMVDKGHKKALAETPYSTPHPREII
ncbi:MAG TPA: tetratricopeptide repeat protein [Candidatus Manganitrophaceae bacterium]|nr:tetratricopeptide repeat protein [Candidatus Manganitrophaceae bacterium]